MRQKGRLTRLISNERDKGEVAGYIGEIRDVITEFQLSVQLKTHGTIEVSR